MHPGDTGQDRIKAFATALVGATKINTEASYAKYVGAEGENFNPAMFEKWGFASVPFDNVITKEFEFENFDYDPWSPLNNVWKIETASDRIDRLSRVLFGSNPYSGFMPIINEPDWQNWNSTHPALSRAVALIKPSVIVDVGVWKGLSTATLARSQSSVNQAGIVIAVDTFLGSPEHWNRERPDVHRSLRFFHGQPRIYETFLSNMILSGLSDRVLPICQTSENAAIILKREGIVPDIVHIDAAHEHAPCLRDIEIYYSLLRPGGILIGDDFNWAEVARAVVHFSDAAQVSFEVDHPKWLIRKPASEP